MATTVTKQEFGKLPTGEAVEIYTLKNDKVEVRLMTWGARLVSVKTPDKNGKWADVCLGYDKLEEWLVDRPHLGSICGRYAGRIKGGKFTLDGVEYQIPINNGKNALHGGPIGFDRKMWTAKEVPNGVALTLVSPDGDMGFPGTLTLTATHTLEGDSLKIAYHATTDKATVLNLTHHAYFNLRGDDVGDVLDTRVKLNAEEYVPCDVEQIPFGPVEPVKGTEMDFTEEHAIRERIDGTTDQLKWAEGYDHTWVLRGGDDHKLKLAAEAWLPESGRTLRVHTTEPAVHMYTGNHLTGAVTGRHGIKYEFRMAICFETQHYPDAPNHPQYPTTLLRPGEEYRSETEFQFGLRES